MLFFAIFYRFLYFLKFCTYETTKSHTKYRVVYYYFVISVFSACLSITKYCVLQFFFMFFMFIVNFAPTKQTKFRTLLWLSQSFLTCMRLPPVYRSHKPSVEMNWSVMDPKRGPSVVRAELVAIWGKSPLISLWFPSNTRLQQSEFPDFF